ncbi:RNA polymerase sporulation-specific sigma factor [Sporomusaceae bacterium BoRhaA]|uniref:SigF/SigG family RNA polymerase sporulation sigma factor n=1 Tax=Pelorhabdus rhamnosifermentans TaxID=2772457 RepID=UPI001C062596|nr:SigF/SigG family RNA polymerase sporulation sigma factor [Pelorhabdus rhamnosifermentans]MBU2700992.1 RNA polymerase sporulation-specific sigma factor [Pelorhabdus rhamnosifermentans]
MLHDEEFKTWLMKAQQGDEAAREFLLEQNFNLVRSIVHRFSNRGYEWDDLFQIGCIGLMKAIERFDLSYNTKFSTYAVPMIIGEIRRFIRDDNPVKVSRPVKELAYKIHRAQEKLQGIKGREPTIAEVAQMLKLDAADIVAALEAIQPVASIFELAFHDDNDSVTLLDQIRRSENQEGPLLDHLALTEILARLPKKERTIIELRFFEDKTQAEIASLIGLSQVQVSRLEKSTLKAIRQFLQTS